jgi:hypothetical protein
MSTTRPKERNNISNEHTTEDDFESLIPAKYRDFDDTQFEKFTKRNDWD